MDEHNKRLKRKKAQLISTADLLLKKLRTEKNEYIIKKHFKKEQEIDPEAEQMLANYALFQILINDAESCLLSDGTMTPELRAAKDEAVNRLRLINEISGS